MWQIERVERWNENCIDHSWLIYIKYVMSFVVMKQRGHDDEVKKKQSPSKSNEHWPESLLTIKIYYNTMIVADGFSLILASIHIIESAWNDMYDEIR